MANYYPGVYNTYPSVPAPAPAYPGYVDPYNGAFNSRYPSTLPSSQPAPQQPQNAPQTQSNVPWIQVPNIEAARNVMVQPNQTAYMMNQNAPEFYVKATDGMGVATLRCFKFAEFDPTQEAAKEVLNSQASNLVSREEFNNFAQNVAAQFNALQQNIVTPAPVAVAPVQQVQPVQQVVPQVVQPVVQPEPASAPVSPPVVRGQKKKEATNDGQGT